MARQITARQQGDDYQARWFWLQACTLLDECSKVERVVYEDTKLKSFDDVAVYYRPGYKDEKGICLNADFYQVKFHVTSNGALKAESLCDPAWINAKTCSLLQRIKDAHDHCCIHNIRYRLILYTPWAIHPDDPLAELHSLSDGSIRWDMLTTVGNRSKLGKVKKLWKDHLGLQEDNDLHKVINNVHIKQGPTLNELAQRLNWRLEAKGLKPVEENKLTHLYDELTRKMLSSNINELTKQSLLDICSREGLLVKAPDQSANTTFLGIRSFLRWAEDMQNQTQSMICLSHHFSERVIKSLDLWNTEISNSLSTFIQKHIIRGNSYRLHLDTHSSIAFLTGYLLPEKMGIHVEVVQHSGKGSSFWRFADKENPSSDLWKFNQETCRSGMTETALAIGLTHDINSDVVFYIREFMPNIGRIILATSDGGPSPSSVRDGGHANELANQLIQYLRSNNVGTCPKNRIHIFFAAPNGFVFCLGRKMQYFPYWALYEYTFKYGIAEPYTPSITNPK